MGRLLKIEWLKIKRYKAFIWLVAAFAVSVFGINYLTWDKMKLLDEFPGEASSMLLGRPFDFPAVWQTVSYLTGFLLVLPGLLVIMLTANEYTFRTHRQSVINGMGRRDFTLSKIWLIVAIAASITLLVTVMALAFGLSGAAPLTLDGIKYAGLFFVQAMLYMSVAFLLVTLFRRSGVSIGIYFLYAFIIENLLSLLLNYKVHNGLGYYLPIKAANKLIPGPVSLGKILELDVPGQGSLLAASLVWVALCLGFCIYRFDRADL